MPATPLRATARALAAALALAAGAAGAQSLADLQRDAATPGDVTTYGMGWGQQRHSALREITPANVKKLAPVWNLSLDNSANASVPAAAGGRRDVHRHPFAHDGRRPGQRPPAVEGAGRPAGRHQRLPVLRHPQPRPRGAGRRALPHHAGRPRRGAVDEGRQAALEEQGRRLQAGLHDDARAADRRRRADHRHLRRRVRHAGLPQRLGPEDRREEVAPLDHRRPGEKGGRHLEARHGRDRRRAPPG